MIFRWSVIMFLAVACDQTIAASGPVGVDHRIAFDQSGIWGRQHQLNVQYASAITVIGSALYLGENSRLGKTSYAAVDSMLLAGAASAGLKLLTQRPRPRTLDDPNVWGAGSKHKSFPSGEVAHITAVISPFIYEYQKDQPSVWALSLLPAYVGLARMKSQAHWQTDVLAGIALGSYTGHLAWKNDNPWSIQLIGNGINFNFRKELP